MPRVTQGVCRDRRARIWATDDVPGRQQFDYWYEFIREVFLQLAAAPIGPCERFPARVRSRLLGDVQLVELEAAAQVVRRTASEIARDGDESCFVNLQLSGGSQVVQNHRRTRLEAGDLVFIDAAVPYEMTFGEEFRQIVLRFPRPRLQAGALSPTVIGGVKVPRGNGLANVLRHSLTGVTESADQLGDTEGAAAGDLIINLLSATLGQSLAAECGGHTGKRLGLLSAVLLYVQAHAHDAALTPDAVAGKFRVSSRTLFQLFKDNGQSFSTTLLDLRLERTERDLADPKLASQSITTIALANGFNDISHFGRVFRRKTGLSPRDYRAGRLGSC